MEFHKTERSQGVKSNRGETPEPALLHQPWGKWHRPGDRQQPIWKEGRQRCKEGRGGIVWHLGSRGAAGTAGGNAMKNRVKENTTFLMQCWFWWAAEAVLFSAGRDGKQHRVARFSISLDG